MESQDQFRFRLKDFERNMSKNWKKLQMEKDFYDVTLACDDNQIQAHKIVLSSCSPVLKNLLCQNLHPHPVFYLRGVKFPDLLNLLNFMYQGEVDVSQESLKDFFNVAEDLKVSGLDKKFLKNNLSQSIDSSLSHQSDYDDVSLICPKNDPKIFKKLTSKSSLFSQDDPYLTMDFKAHDKSNESKFKDETVKKAVKTNGSMSRTPYIDSNLSHQSFYDDVSLICPKNDPKIFKKLTSQSSLFSQDDPYLYMDFKAHDKSNESKFKYETVKKAVKTNGSLSRTPYTCDKCKSKFTSKYSLEIHTLSHHKPAYYLCEQCNEKYLKRSNMSGHIELSKCGTAYFCSKTDNQFIKKMTLKRHIESVQNELNNVCENCACEGFQKLAYHERSFQSSIETSV